jgi:transcription elongation factor GreA
MNENTTILSKQGYKNLKKKLKELKKEQERLVEDMEAARQEGDLSENSAYHNLRESVTLVRNQIGDLEQKLANVEIRDKEDNGSVGFGSTVKVKVNGDTKTIQVVGDGEADPLKGKISYKSPIGQGLVGKKKGQTATIETPGGEKEYTILEIK